MHFSSRFCAPLWRQALFLARCGLFFSVCGAAQAAVSSHASVGVVSYSVYGPDDALTSHGNLLVPNAHLFVDGAASEAGAPTLTASATLTATGELSREGHGLLVSASAQWLEANAWLGKLEGAAQPIHHADGWASYRAYLTGPLAVAFEVPALSTITFEVPYRLAVSVVGGADAYASADVSLTAELLGASWLETVYLSDWAPLSVLANGESVLEGSLRLSFLNAAATSRAGTLTLDASIEGYASAVPEMSALALFFGGVALLSLRRVKSCIALIAGLAFLASTGPAFAQKTSCSAVTAATCAVAQSLGRGVNFGNMLDAPAEGAWGVSVMPAYIEVATQAFQTVRLPVRWSNHAAPTIDGKLDEAFARRVDQVVDALLARGVYVLLDFHHHMQLNGAALHPGEFKVDDAVLDARFINIWRQVAARYRSRSPKLLFEILNEPSGRLTAARWNVLAARALAVIRVTNPTRAVVVDVVRPSLDADYAALSMPATDKNLIMGAHVYEPVNFTHQYGSGPRINCCDDVQKAQIRQALDRMVNWSQRTGYPVHLGEFGSYERAPVEGRAAYARFVRDEAETRGMGWAYWEFASTFGVYPAKLNDWVLPIKEALLN